MFDRDLPPDLVTTLNSSPFWANICRDRELHPEIRSRCVTVYYRGRGLIRNICLRDGRLTARIHRKYVPVERFTGPEDSNDVELLASAVNGLEFGSLLAQPIPLGLCSESILADYKHQMAGAKSFPESDLIQKIICRDENQVLDQEIAFQESKGDRDKIDLCNFDDSLKKLTFVEVKRIDDPRLLPNEGPPEVLEQLRAYGCRLAKHRNEVLSAYQRTVVLKRQLGLGERFRQVPDDGPHDLLERPILVIGNCKSTDIDRIRNGIGYWQPLMDGLSDVAAGLILSGRNGCRLRLEKGPQALVF